MAELLEGAGDTWPSPSPNDGLKDYIDQMLKWMPYEMDVWLISFR